MDSGAALRALRALDTLCLLLCFFLRRTAARPPATAPASRLPQADLQQLLEHAHDVDRAPDMPPPRPAMPPPQNPSSRVINALRDVLMQGLVVPTAPDDRRRRSARRG